jgi:ketosteroid isomerase-like protein
VRGAQPASREVGGFYAFGLYDRGKNCTNGRAVLASNAAITYTTIALGGREMSQPLGAGAHTKAQDLVAQNLACVDGHFHSEAENDVEAALELYTDDIVFEAAALNGLNRLFSGKQAVAKFYRELWATMRNVQFQFLQRFATEDRVVDDSLVTFEVMRDGCWPHFSAGQKIEMRLVHIFEMRDGKISKEIIFDMGRPV